MRMPWFSRRLSLAASLAFLSGWADVVCLVRFSSFAGMQTGNAVMVGVKLADEEHGPLDALYHLVIMASNLLGVVLYEALSRTVALRPSAWLVAVLVGLATASSDILDAIAGPSQWDVCFVAAAFGAQNALTGSEAQLGVSTTIMTGNLQKLGAALALRLVGRAVPQKQALSSTLSAAVIASTVLGAMVAALALRAAGRGPWPYFAPIALLQAAFIGLLGLTADSQPSTHERAQEQQGLRMADSAGPSSAACAQAQGVELEACQAQPREAISGCQRHDRH